VSLTESILYSKCLGSACKQDTGDRLVITGFEAEQVIFVATGACSVTTDNEKE
jgi:hypothetical protein